MYGSDIPSRVYTAVKQCKHLLENHDRERQVLCDEPSSGSDSLMDVSSSYYDSDLCFKIKEAELACLTMDRWFDENGSFKDTAMEQQVVDLFSYCSPYAEEHSPILVLTIKDLIGDIDPRYLN
ncbi:hypothetical protein [Methylobacterium cerastii]|uniref:hypothetical protein n=1 Tax=Methylobacterium cerastii TaxID=932741 RepID=UPI001EE1ABFF|nr:hypothetical protein [Methylobacterium cerastii]